jgi:AraC-like DNA-binding protein
MNSPAKNRGVDGIARMGLSPQCLQLAALFDWVDDVLAWIKERDGRYCWVNRTFLLNYSLGRRQDGGSATEGVVGKTDYDLSPPFLADQFRTDDEYVLSGRRIVNRIEMVMRPDGSAEWNVTNKIPLLDEKGVVVGTAGITRNLGAGEGAAALDVEFGRVLVYFRDHYHSAVNNRRLASLVHMSVRAFERKFLRTFHTTPQTYLRKLRLRMASRALVYGTQSLADVAASCGFSDQSHFTRVFREHFGETPRTYRTRHTRDGIDAALVPKDDASEQEGTRRASI